jgi:hypothetical protein
MFSITLKRSAATLGVVAGLLVAAVPASAQVLPGMIGVTTPHTGSKAPASPMWVWHEAARNSIGTAEVFELNTFGGSDTLRANSSEVAVESLTLAVEPRKGRGFFDIPAELNY